MSEKRYVVPEGMLTETEVAIVNSITSGHNKSWEMAKVALEAALRWQSENPIVPTDEQIDGMSVGNFSHGAGRRAVKRGAVEWQRRMYLAPEPVLDAALGGALLGRTFTREQANAMKHIIDTAVHDSAPEWDCRADGEEPTNLGMKFPRVEQKVPDEIKQLVKSKRPYVPDLVNDSINAEILEAFRRGQKAGLK